jgi:hypothetical protein
MTEPDGKIPQIGDSSEVAGLPADLGAARWLRDDQTGWIIGRWSWTDPDTSYYTIRYGPARFAHGHHDRAGGVTWSVLGVWVLVGPGVFTYDTTSKYQGYQGGAQAQNVAIPSGGAAGAGKATVTSAVYRAANHRYALQDTVYGIRHLRGVIADRDLVHIVVADSFPKASVWRQSWHLDPQWKLSSSASTRLVFTHPSGRRLTVLTTGRVSSVMRGETNPPRGWHFPAFGFRVPAAEIVIRNFGKACTSTFTVS